MYAIRSYYENKYIKNREEIDMKKLLFLGILTFGIVTYAWEKEIEQGARFVITSYSIHYTKLYEWQQF